MTCFEAIELIDAYRKLYANKMDSYWRKNPNLTIGHAIGTFEAAIRSREPEDELEGWLEKRAMSILSKPPRVAKVVKICLSEDSIEKIKDGGSVTVLSAGGVVVKVCSSS